MRPSPHKDNRTSSARGHIRAGKFEFDRRNTFPAFRFHQEGHQRGPLLQEARARAVATPGLAGLEEEDGDLWAARRREGVSA